MTIDMAEWVPIIAQIVIIGGGVAGMYWAVKRWVRDISETGKSTAKQLETSNGHTAGELLEDIAIKVDELGVYGKENRTLIEHVSERLDAHLKGHS